jgi:hypothetical protein
MQLIPFDKLTSFFSEHRESEYGDAWMSEAGAFEALAVSMLFAQDRGGSAGSGEKENTRCRILRPAGNNFRRSETTSKPSNAQT